MPGDTPFDAALAALDVEPRHDAARMVTTYDILGLDAVRAAHRAEVERAVAERDALRGEVATLRGARSAEDVCEMLCEASCVDVTPERCARIWSLLEHPATTMTTLAVIADERGESYAKVAAEFAALSARVARLEAALREIAGRGPKDDPCAAEYDADGKRWSEVGGEATWCTYTSDESQEESAHASDVAAYAAAKIARAALEDKP